MTTDTNIAITRQTARLQFAARKGKQLDRYSGVFFRSGYAFATEGHYLAILRTMSDEPQSGCLKLPLPTARSEDIRLEKVGSRYVSERGSVADIVDMDPPPVDALVRHHNTSTDAIKLTINAQFLLDLAKSIGGVDKEGYLVTIEISPSNLDRPILVCRKDSSTLGVLMPVRADPDIDPSVLLATIKALL